MDDLNISRIVGSGDCSVLDRSGDFNLLLDISYSSAVTNPVLVNESRLDGRRDESEIFERDSMDAPSNSILCDDSMEALENNTSFTFNNHSLLEEGLAPVNLSFHASSHQLLRPTSELIIAAMRISIESTKEKNKRNQEETRRLVSMPCVSMIACQVDSLH